MINPNFTSSGSSSVLSYSEGTAAIATLPSAPAILVYNPDMANIISVVISYIPIEESYHTTGDIVDGSNRINSVADMTGVEVGKAISGIGIPGDTYIDDFNVDDKWINMTRNALVYALNNPITISTTNSVPPANIEYGQGTFIGAGKSEIISLSPMFTSAPMYVSVVGQSASGNVYVTPGVA